MVSDTFSELPLILNGMTLLRRLDVGLNVTASFKALSYIMRFSILHWVLLPCMFLNLLIHFFLEAEQFPNLHH